MYDTSKLSDAIDAVQDILKRRGAGDRALQDLQHITTYVRDEVRHRTDHLEYLD